MDGDADRAGLVRDRARRRLADPPRRIRGELIAALVLELLDGLHEARVALLDEIQEREAAVHVLLHDRNDEAQVGLNHLFAGLAPTLERNPKLFKGFAELVGRHAEFRLQFFQVFANFGEFGVAALRAPLAGKLPLTFLQRNEGQIDCLVRLVTKRLQYLLLEIEVEEGLAQCAAGILHALFRTADLLGRRLLAVLLEFRQLGLGLVEALRDVLEHLAEGGQLFHVGVAVIVELVRDDAVEALLHALELVEEAHVHARREGEAVEHVLRLRLALLDALADVNLLLAREERHLSHLVQVHADRIVEHLLGARGLQTAVALLVLVRAVGLHVLGADHVHIQRLEDRQILVRRRFVLYGGRHDLVELVVGDETAVLLGALLHLLDDRVALFGAEHAAPRIGSHVLGVGIVAETHGRRNRHAVVQRRDEVEVGLVRHVGRICGRVPLGLHLARDLLDVQIARLGLRLLGLRLVFRRRLLEFRRGFVLRALRHVERLLLERLVVIRNPFPMRPLLLFARLRLRRNRLRRLGGDARILIFPDCHDNSRLQF